MDRLEAFRTIAAEVHGGDLRFPTSVGAALKIQQVLNDPDCHMQTAAKLVAGEPMLAARTVAVANSAAYNRFGTEITSVATAAARLGFRTLQTLAASTVVRQIGGKSTNPTVRAKTDQLWEHTVHVAALAQIIAREIKKVDPETALFAGIIHEVGGFYLLSRASQFPELLDGDPEAWVTYGQTLVGRGVFKALAVPDSVVAAVETLWHNSGKLPPETLGDVLHLAKSLAPVPSPLPVDAASGLSAPRLEIEIGDGSLSDLLAESDAEVNSLVAALMH